MSKRYKGLELSNDTGTKPEGNKSTCCPKDQVFNGTTCIPGNTTGLMKCPPGWGCQGYGEGEQCWDNYGILTCGGGAVSSTDGKNKGLLEDTAAGTNIILHKCKCM